jgi:hypothetical protein
MINKNGNTGIAFIHPSVVAMDQTQVPRLGAASEQGMGPDADFHRNFGESVHDSTKCRFR